jgi:hypothetical protein
MTKKLLTDEDAIYAAVGRALTTWGGVEDALGQVYCVTVNPRHFEPAERAYWAIASFEGRLKMTRLAIEQRTRPYPLLPLLLPIWTLLDADLTAQNGIRNQIAHGSVVDVTVNKHLLSKARWRLIPYHHSRKREALNEGLRKAAPKLAVKDNSYVPIDDKPKERMTLKQLGGIMRDFAALEKRLEEFYLVVERQARAQEGVPLADEGKNQRLLTILSSLPSTENLPRARS